MVDLKKQLRGVLGFPVTPYRADMSLDLAALEKNVDAMARHSFCALVAAGGTGEVYSMTPAESIEVVRVTVKAASGRMPVIGGVGFNTPMAVEMARGMEKAGAAALLVMPPYYINAPEAGMTEYFAAIGKASGLPLSFYSRDWAVFTPDMVARLAERIPTLSIWKDGQGDARKYQRIMSHVGDRLAWLGGIGDDCVPAYFAIGVQAYTSSISNIAPRLSLALADAAVKGDRERLNDLMRRFVQPLYALRERSRGYEVTVMKAAMEMLGMPAGPVRPPLCALSARDTEDVRKLMDVYREWTDGAAAATH
jgi:5-dehydro-4-deoxyglucarate dehydratase